MAQQVQCPNCHNYRVTKQGSITFGCLAAIIGFIAFGYLSLGFLSGSGEMFLVVLLIFVAVIGAMAFARRQQPWVCKNCGFQWKSST